MPELPEVETVRRSLAPVLEGYHLTSIQAYRTGLRFPLPPQLDQALQDQSVIAVRRRAKYLLIDFDPDTTLIWHLGMSGRVVIEKAAQAKELECHDHVVFTTSSGHRIVFRDPRRFGFMLLAATSDLYNLKPFVHLGPEPLEGLKTVCKAFAKRICNRKMPVKNALLDQNIIAGVGNIYASEALWQAQISPWRAAGSLGPKEIERLIRELQDVLNRAIAAGGSTLRDHAQPNGETGYFQHSFKVYNQHGTPCHHCKTNLLRKTVQSGRATYYCEACQL